MSFFTKWLLFSVCSIICLFDFQSDTEGLILPTRILTKVAENQYLQNEYLILPKKPFLAGTKKILQDYGLEKIASIGEWVLAKKSGVLESQRLLALKTSQAQKDQRFVLLLENDDRIHSASLNFYQNYEDGCYFKEPKEDELEFLPNDVSLNSQWHLGEVHGANVKNAWQIAKGSKKHTIAIVDRNFYLDAGDFSSYCPSRSYYVQNMQGYFPLASKNNPKSEPHGNQVLSLLAPCTNNRYGLAGVDWFSNIMLVDTGLNRSLGARMTSALWAAGVDLCKKYSGHCGMPKNPYPAKIINTSFGFAGNFLKDPPYGPILDIIADINNHGGMVVASSGNEGTNADKRLPAAAGGVISVGASTKARKAAFFSNYGKSVDFLAPGQNVLGFGKDTLQNLNGTSFSAPIISGIASLLLEVNPNYSWKHVEYLLKETADEISCQDYCPFGGKKGEDTNCLNLCCQDGKNICSKGVVNAYEALILAQQEKFETVLVDMDDYFVPLNPQNQYKRELTIKNWGTKSGFVRFSSSNSRLRAKPKNIYLPKASSIGEAGTRKVVIFYKGRPKKHEIVDFSFKAKDGANQDEIIGVVDIMPK